MEPCYKLHHHGTKRSLDLAMSSERSSVGRVAEGGRSEPALLGGERGTRENCAGSIVPLAFSYVGKALELYDGKLLWGLVQTPLHYCYYPTKPAQSQSTDMLWLSSRHSPNCWIRNFHLAIKSWMGSSFYWLFKCEGLYAFQGSLGPILRGKWLALLWTEIISLVT